MVGLTPSRFTIEPPHFFAGAHQKSKLIQLKSRLFSVMSAHILCQDEGILGQVFGNSACAKQMLIQYIHGQRKFQLEVNCHISLWLFKERLATCSRRTCKISTVLHIIYQHGQKTTFKFNNRLPIPAGDSMTSVRGPCVQSESGCSGSWMLKTFLSTYPVFQDKKITNVNS